MKKVYQNASMIELKDVGLQIEKVISIAYKRKIVGEYFADILVD